MSTFKLGPNIMHRLRRACCIVYVLLHIVYGYEAACDFPEFLYQPPSGHRSRVWITEVRYEEGSTDWASYVNVTVRRDVIKGFVKTRGQCDEPHTMDCLITVHLYTQHCVDVVDGKYLVANVDEHESRHRSTGKYRQEFSCLEFELINQNIVLAKESEAYDHGARHRCSDRNNKRIRRNEWPWLAPVQYEWSKCPMKGGYDFRAYTPSSRELTCDDFIPNRIESECVLGDGFILTYTSSDCSPFNRKQLRMTLMCWGNWEEDGYRFVIAGQPGSYPQFALRTPLIVNDTRSEAHMYFNPVAPLTGNGKPSFHQQEPIEYYRLLIKRSEPALCYDESDRCTEYAKAGKCRNSAMFVDAKYCKKSCGLCNFTPVKKAECDFDPEIKRHWVMFEKDRKEDIDITQDGIMKFSSLGVFYCKGKQWNAKDYKLFSSYSNGCRPRYTCLRMEALEGDNKAQFQISKSSLTDDSFDLCENIHDDPWPIGGAVRSNKSKLMIPKGRTKANTCGLHGQINVTMQSKAGECYGTMSDYNEISCGFESQLKVVLHGNCDKSHKENRRQKSGYENEFRCESYITLEDDYNLLITRSTRQPEQYNCWVIRTYSERMGYRLWRTAYLMDGAQCGWPDELHPSVLKRSALLSLSTPDVRYRPCVQPKNTGTPMSISPDVGLGYSYPSSPHKTETQQVRGHSPSLHTASWIVTAAISIPKLWCT